MEGVIENGEVEESALTDVIETIVNMFGDLISKEVVTTVVESCAGDLNLSLDALMNITTDCTSAPQSEELTTISQNEIIIKSTINPVNALQPVVTMQGTMIQPSTSYAAMSQSPEAVTKLAQKPHTPLESSKDQLSKLVMYHDQGSRLLIILRGVPGSGKSYLARQIINKTIGSNFSDYSTHILSTDDFFMVRGQYLFDKIRLSEAHMWNQKRFWMAANQGLSPIIIDNTNIEAWEMEPYVRDGVRNGYIIEVVEPNTPWAKKAFQLMKLNNHDVPLPTIKRMLSNYQEGVTGAYLLQYFRLSYPSHMVPPVMRTIPPVSCMDLLVPASENIYESRLVEDKKADDQLPMANVSNVEAQQNMENSQEQTPQTTNENSVLTDATNNTLVNLGATGSLPYNKDGEYFTEKHKLLMEAQQRLDEMEKVEREWENGENWDINTDNSRTTKTNKDDITSPSPKPPRKMIELTPRESLIDSVNKCDDWTKISMFMSPWIDMTSPIVIKSPEIPVETSSIGTCVEIGDTDVNTTTIHKVISATPRDINEYYMPLNKEKIPEKRMLDKSSMTNDQFIMEAFKCKNAEKHFVAFRKMFKNVPRPALRDIFDKCCGDVNWAVDIVLSGMANKELDTLESDDISDPEEESIEQCACLAAYNIIPGGETSSNPIAFVKEDQIGDAIPDTTLVAPKKSKKDIAWSETSIEIKRQIEKNVVISEDHYSEHCLKIRKMRRGECDKTEDTYGQASTSTTPEDEQNLSPDESPNENPTFDLSDIEDSDNESVTSREELEKTININLGMEFITQLDELFGRRDMEYPDTVRSTITVTVSMLNQINALWMESFMNQLDEQSAQSEIMIQQDEDFARQLASKEEELSLAGKEPPVPDFKEIMDMDLALSLYQKDVAEWRNHEPKDLAAKMTREKLYNLFPKVPQDILSELLMAHDNNFQSTVESLLVSTGKTDILQAENGVNKFVMEQEMLRKENILEEERKALSDIEWPYLTKGEVVEMSTVNNYRDEAEKHLVRRNMNYHKAEEYIRRGMTQVAYFYSDIAAYHKERYEHYSSLAAVCLIQLHAANNRNNATVDLHFLRVVEAMASLDIFLDTYIQKLKEIHSKTGQKHRTIYIITGRGKHSQGRPKVKPAVKRRLRERGLVYSEMNPGLLTTKLSADSKLSHEIK